MRFKQGLCGLILAGSLAGPAIMPSVFNSQKLYAQEEKKETLQELVSKEVEALTKKENKTAEDYIRLIHFYFDYYGDRKKVESIAGEAKEKIDENSPEYLYVKAMWSLPVENSWGIGCEAYDLRDEILKSSKTSLRLKADALLRIFYDEGEYYTDNKLHEEQIKEAFKLDPFNLAVHAAMFEHIYPSEMFQLSGTENVSRRVRKHEKEYKEIMKRHESDNSPEKLIHLAKLYKGFAKVMRQAARRIPDRNKSLRAKYIDLADDYYVLLNEINPTYENYINQGLFNIEKRKDLSSSIKKDIEIYDYTANLFVSAQKFAKTEEEKGVAMLYEGKSLYEKLFLEDMGGWVDLTPIKKSQIEDAKRAYNCFITAFQTTTESDYGENLYYLKDACVCVANIQKRLKKK